MTEARYRQAADAGELPDRSLGHSGDPVSDAKADMKIRRDGPCTATSLCVSRPRQPLCNFAGRLDEEFGQRAERPILQRENCNSSLHVWQFDRQRLQERIFAGGRQGIS